MNLSDEVDLEDYVSRPDKISAAEVSCFHAIYNYFLKFEIYYGKKVLWGDLYKTVLTGYPFCHLLTN